MIRMTLALVVAIAAVMMIWGQPQERAEGSDQPGSPTEIEEVAASRNVGEVTRLALDDDLGAYEIALAASRVKLETPIPHQSSLSSTIMPELPTNNDLPGPAEVAALPTRTWVVTGSRVNLRAGPSTSAVILGRVSLGDRAELLEDPGTGWLRIRTSTFEKAWISGRYLRPFN